MIYPELIEAAVKGYTEALLWANAYTENGDSILDASVEYSLSDFSEVDQAHIINQVWDFCMNNAGEMLAYIADRGPVDYLWGADSAEAFGHDFLLTSSGHGTGFWDRGLPDDLSDKLTAASRPYGDPHVTVMNDGRLLLD